MVEVSANEKGADIELAGIEAHGPLLAAIADSPDDAAPWTVYADLLQTLDHPRGELITLMMEREAHPSSRLLELQRRAFAAAGKVLRPVEVPSEVVVGWRRGFPSELRVTAPEQLVAIQRDPTLRLVATATLVIHESHEVWTGVLEAVHLPWKHVRVELAAEQELVVRPILEALPALKTLRIAAPDAGAFDWTDARSDSLESLTLVNASVDGLEHAALPRLTELRLIGSSEATHELRGSVLWGRLQRVVLPAPEYPDDDEPDDEDDDEVGPKVITAAALAGPAIPNDDDDEYNDYAEPHVPGTAFFIIDQPLTRALLRKLAANVSISSLAARICSVRTLPRVTVIQLFGPSDAELMPYRFALALESVMQPTPRIALVEIDGDRAARHLVLGTKQIRATEAVPAEAVRRALDLAVGYDPGAAILTEILDELAVTPIEHLRGDGPVEQLTNIDPSSAPLVMVPEPENIDEDEYGEDEDHESDWDDYDDLDLEQYEPSLDDYADEEPEEPPKPITTPPAIAAKPAELPRFLVDLDLDDEPALLDDEPAPPDDDALVMPPYDRPELWFDYAENWEDRAVVVDDEELEVRWPDPEYAEQRATDDTNWRAEPACAHHQLALEHCNWCNAMVCAECEGEDWCADCFAIVIGLVQPEWLYQMRQIGNSSPAAGAEMTPFSITPSSLSGSQR